MDLGVIAAWGYGALCGVLAVFQLALVAGAPWGEFTQGGRVRGRLDRRGRAMAAISFPINVFMGAAILAAGGAVGWTFPGWTAWVALALTVLTAGANWMTPSSRERAIWGPITLLMLGLALGALFL